ncbi:hypothetical protein GF319_00925 [Candidatus Bathyarchaeota archaeon]|nr:hypothetical protein [Candidatus Bathyarchaeota archaeon]
MIGLLIRLGILAATGSLFLIILLAYRRVPSQKMGFIASGFGFMFIHAILLMPEVMLENYTMGFTENTHLFIHFIALVLITAGILKD